MTFIAFLFCFVLFFFIVPIFNGVMLTMTVTKIINTLVFTITNVTTLFVVVVIVVDASLLIAWFFYTCRLSHSTKLIPRPSKGIWMI